MKDENHKASLFNLSCLFHMVELPSLAVYYIEKYLLLDAEDTTVQACKYIV